VLFIGGDDHERIQIRISEEFFGCALAPGHPMPIGHFAPPFDIGIGDGRQLHLWESSQHRRVELAEAADTEQSDPQGRRSVDHRKPQRSAAIQRRHAPG
jgi:hypothetical protein